MCTCRPTYIIPEHHKSHHIAKYLVILYLPELIINNNGYCKRTSLCSLQIRITDCGMEVDIDIEFSMKWKETFKLCRFQMMFQPAAMITGLEDSVRKGQILGGLRVYPGIYTVDSEIMIFQERNLGKCLAMSFYFGCQWIQGQNTCQIHCQLLLEPWNLDQYILNSCPSLCCNPLLTCTSVLG